MPISPHCSSSIRQCLKVSNISNSAQQQLTTTEFNSKAMMRQGKRAGQGEPSLPGVLCSCVTTQAKHFIIDIQLHSHYVRTTKAAAAEQCVQCPMCCRWWLCGHLLCIYISLINEMIASKLVMYGLSLTVACSGDSIGNGCGSCFGDCHTDSCCISCSTGALSCSWQDES